MKHSDKVFESEERSCCVDINLSTLKSAGLEIHLGLTDMHIYLEPEEDAQYDKMMDAVPTNLSLEDQEELLDAISKTYNHIVIKRMFIGASKMKVRK